MKSAATNNAKKSKWLIIIGFLFLVNPCPGGLDLIPDAIGCLLLLFGLAMLAYFDSSVEEARKYVIWLFAVETVKLALMRSVFLTEISSNRLLAATVFSVLEGIIGILLYKKLFEGISYYAMRRDCSLTLKRCEGISFLTYLALFSRIAATLIPELLAIVELNIETEVDLDKVDAMTDLVSTRPILTVLLSMLALGIGIAWYVSLCRLFTAFFAEAGEEMSARYAEEYTSRPSEIRPGMMFRGSVAMKLALVFALDIAFDGVRVLPVCAMFLGIFIAMFFYRGIGDFEKTQKYAIPAFILFLAAEAFARLFVPYGAVVIYETPIWVVAVNAVLAVSAATFGLLCIYSLLDGVSAMSKALGGDELCIKTARVMYVLTLLLWAVGYVVPYFYSYISTFRFICAAVFILQCARLFSVVWEEEAYRASLRPRDDAHK